MWIANPETLSNFPRLLFRAATNADNIEDIGHHCLGRGPPPGSASSQSNRFAVRVVHLQAIPFASKPAERGLTFDWLEFHGSRGASTVFGNTSNLP